MAVELTSPILWSLFPFLHHCLESGRDAHSGGKAFWGRKPGRNQDGGPGFLAGSETASRGVQLEHLNMGAAKDEAGKEARWERIGKGQHILLRQRGVMKDA